jgi:hypothetical protein
MVKYLITLEMEVDYGDEKIDKMPLVVLDQIESVLTASPFGFVKTRVVRAEREKIKEVS